MRRYAFLILLAMAALASMAQVSLGFRGEEAASVGIYVKDLSTGQVLASNDEKRALLPASTMKAVTAAAAWQKLGPYFAFKTPVYLVGSMADSAVWKGDLVIESCGDPTIDSELFNNMPSLADEIIKGLRGLGVRRITGQVAIVETLQQPGCIPFWEIDDTPWAYGAGLYGFNFNDNKFSLWPATGKTSPYIPGFAYETYTDPDGTDLAPSVGVDYLLVGGRDIENPKWRVSVAMTDPAAAYEALLIEKLAEAGIEVGGEDAGGDADAETLLVCEHFSPELADILYATLGESHNLFAEGILRALAMGGSRKDALQAEQDALAALGLMTTCNKICDGSGLARADHLQAVFLSDVLEAMAKTSRGQAFVGLFPKAGCDGTVKSLLEKTRLKGRLALKSGSMSGVQCFAGYKLDDEGKPTHTVVILINGFFCPRGELRGAIENFLLKTF